jgi:hypothetical protein
VLHNDGTLAQLQRHVETLHQRLLELAQEEGNRP